MPYSFVKKITIDKTKVPNTDQINFPVLFEGVYPYLATVANGGDVTNVNGYDIIFALDALGTIPLDFEIELYDQVTGASIFWVRLPTVFTAVDTEFYILYGNAAIVTSQENIPGTWNANYKTVYHLNDNAANTNVKDSTATANTGTSKVNTNVVRNSAQIGYGLEFDTTPHDVIAAPVVAVPLSFEMWVWSFGYSSENTAIELTDGAGLPIFSFQASFPAAGQPDLIMGSLLYYYPTILSLFTFYHIACTWDGVTFHLYINGVEFFPSGVVGGYTPDAASLLMIGTLGATSIWNWSGVIDEVRVSDNIRSQDWVITNYNNQFDPATFYSISSVSSSLIKTFNGLINASMKAYNTVLNALVKTVNGLSNQ